MPEAEIKTLQRIYTAIQQSDWEEMAGSLAHDVEWTLPETLPWGGTHHGHLGVQAITEAYEERYDGLWADADEFIEDGDTIVVLGRMLGKAHATGVEFELQFAHIWRMTEGMPSSFRGYFDTAPVMAALEGTSPSEGGGVTVPESAKELIRSGALGHLVTINADGSPQITCVWVAVEGDDLVTAHLDPGQRKLENVRRDPRVSLSFEGTEIHDPGMREYIVAHGSATIEEGGAPELLQELAYAYLGPDVRFPPMDDPPPGVRLRIAVERIAGVGPWAQ